MIEIMRRSVAERTTVNERSLQSEMQTHLSCEVDCALTDLRLIRFAGAGVSLWQTSRQACGSRNHELPRRHHFLPRRIVGKRGDSGNVATRRLAASMVRIGSSLIDV